MSRSSPAEPAAAPLAARAEREIEFIRRTMERSSGFTAVPGWGGVGMGVVALAAAALATRQTTARAWLAVWLLAAGVAFALGVVSIDARPARAGVDPLGHSARAFAAALVPALAVGAVLTGVLYRAGSLDLLPGVWLALRRRGRGRRGLLGAGGADPGSLLDRLGNTRPDRSATRRPLAARPRLRRSPDRLRPPHRAAPWRLIAVRFDAAPRSPGPRGRPPCAARSPAPRPHATSTG